MNSSLHLHGSLEHLSADHSEAAGSWQAIDEAHVKGSLKRSKLSTDCRMVHFQTTGGAGERPTLRHGQEMPDVFPIDHLCKFSRITRIYTEFSHRANRRIFLDQPIFGSSRWRSCNLNGEAKLREGEPNTMAGQRFRVGIVGLKPGRGWAVQAHTPALRALSETFEIVGVANTNRASAEEAAAATGLPRAFADVAEIDRIAGGRYRHHHGEGALSLGDREGSNRSGQTCLLRMAAG